jgi:hypothetical protein
MYKTFPCYIMCYQFIHLIHTNLYIYITLGSHKLLQTCGASPSFIMLLIMYSKCKKLLINFPSLQMMLLLQNNFMSQHVKLTKLVHTHAIHNRHDILKMTGLYMMKIEFSSLFICLFINVNPILRLSI